VYIKISLNRRQDQTELLNY